MPITPFHFGPGAAIHAAAPRYVSFLAFCAANVLIDVEPLYYILTRQYPLHRFFHTYIGASIVAISTLALFAVSRRGARALWLPNSFDWQELGIGAVAMGAFAGTLSHVLLDSVMHPDIRPLAPFSDSNPLLGAISVQALHWSCVVTGLVGIAVLGVQSIRREPS
jgi:membrane-bound metal-dependent hydrolase YbcI (DUF457 family)